VGAIGFFAVCIAIIAIGWAICERIWIHSDGNDALQQTTPLERLTAAAVAGAMLWLGVNWLLALTHTLTRASLLIAAVACMIAALILIRRNFALPRAGVFALIVCLPIVLWIAYVLWRGFVLPPDNHDALAYHFPKAVFMAETHGYGYFVTADPRVTVLPANYELLLTDILHAFASNPLAPPYDKCWQTPQVAGAGFAELPSGIQVIGFTGRGYCFDNELPAHRVFVQPARISRSLVSNARWLEFMEDGGYLTPSLWLSDGWTALETEQWQAPGYWRNVDGAWFSMTLGGQRAIDPDAPVTHVSYYEADAFARWAGKHLPSEAEWEIAARADLLGDGFGAAWQWTRSAYLPYPGYSAVPGALGEYNGKFMVNQMVLRGSSHTTPADHSRATYRNLFYPSARWQFSGVRLLDYLA